MLGIERARSLRKCLTLLRVAFDRGDHVALQGWVSVFNAVSLPWGYVFVADNGRIHVVRIVTGSQETSQHAWPTLMHDADVYWDFEPLLGRWTVRKDRDDAYGRGYQTHFGGQCKSLLNHGTI